MPFYRQNARFDPEGRLSPRCAIPSLPVRHKYIPGIGAATRTPHRYRCCPVSKFHPPLPRFDRSTPHRLRPRGPVGGGLGDWSAAGRVRWSCPGHFLSRKCQKANTQLSRTFRRSYGNSTLVRRGCRLPPHPPAADWSPNPIPTGLPGRWNGSCGRKRKRAHAHVCMQMCAHMLACNHTHPPLCALCLRRRF